MKIVMAGIISVLATVAIAGYIVDVQVYAAMGCKVDLACGVLSHEH